MSVANVDQMVLSLQGVLSHAVVQGRKDVECRMTTVTSPEAETRKHEIGEPAQNDRGSQVGKT